MTKNIWAISANSITSNDSSLHKSEGEGRVSASDSDEGLVVKALDQQGSKMAFCRWRWDWFCNCILWSIVLVMIGLFAFDLIPFKKIGFYCGDPKIAYKYRGDTITLGILLGSTLAIPLIGFGIVEVLFCDKDESCILEEKDKPAGVRLAWYWYRKFLLGLCILTFVTEAMKSIISEPRPHFLDSCRPDKAVNCTPGYVATFECTNTRLSRLRVKDSFRSFPSGHSAFGVYVGIVMICFFQKRITASSYLVVPWLQCLCVFWAMICCLTRITDRRHHWWDVLAGSIFGVVMAVLTVRTFCHGFKLHNTRSHSKETANKDVAVNGARHHSSRRLLSSTSSYSNTTPPDDRELREVEMS